VEGGEASVGPILDIRGKSLSGERGGLEKKLGSGGTSHQIPGKGRVKC